MGESPGWGRYAELRPDQLATLREESATAYLPWGTLEWHGPHLPFGLDGIVAEAIAERAARRTGGVLLPTTWWPVGKIPHRDGIDAPAGAMSELWDGLFAQLAAAGWRIVVLVNGSSAQSHELALISAAQAAMKRYQLLILAMQPLTLVDESMIDHAGLWETSLLMALRPDLVQLDALGSGPLNPGESAVIGRDPRNTAAASLGVSALNLAVDRMATAVTELQHNPDPSPLYALYAQRSNHLQAFFQRYGNHPKTAMRAWWEELTREAEQK